MLQPQQTTDEQILMTSRIIWGALSLSMFLYGYILIQLGKVSEIFLPHGNVQPLELAALGINGIAILTFLFHRSRIHPLKSFQQKLPLYILGWALNEMIVVASFVATFVGESGNGFYYLANLLIALAGNILLFPRK